MSGESPWPYEMLRAHADAILAAAEQAGAVVRLMGGLAVRERAVDTGGLPAEARQYHDIDLVGRVRDVRAIDRIFARLGYRADTEMNTQFGTIRRIYHHPDGFHVDLFLDRLEFCHTIVLDGRLQLHPRTLAPADLLLQKLQIVERNLKDHIDVWWLLLNHELGGGSPEAIELDRVTKLASDDWGLYTTVCDFLDETEQHIAGAALDLAARTHVSQQLAALREAIVAAPKSLRWRARERVGRRVRWYRPVEEIL